MARNKLVWLVCLAILSVLPAGATLQTYTTLLEWQAAATQSGVTIDFSSLGVIDGNFSPAALSLLIDPVTFTAPPIYQLQVVHASPTQPWYDWGTHSILRPMDDGRPLQAAWTTPVTAFAALMGITKIVGGVPATSQMDVKVYRSGVTEPVWQQTLGTAARPTLTFFGIVSTNPAVTFDSVTFTPADGNTTTAYLDDVRLGAYKEPVVDPLLGEAPEMGTGVLSLCGGILLAAGGFRMRGKLS
jgi:hypothetical protein